jgi:hypothetical protein
VKGEDSELGFAPAQEAIAAYADVIVVVMIVTVPVFAIALGQGTQYLSLKQRESIAPHGRVPPLPKLD